MHQVITGLGNPGKQYETTRHNAGFMALDALAKQLGLSWIANKKFKAEIAKGVDVILLKPSNFMNNSGFSVAAALAFYKLLPKKFGVLNIKSADLSNRLTVVHDDLDIPLGEYKISVDSRSAGHNGVQSIIDRLKTKNFKRLRIGIKQQELEKVPADKFVLQKFKPEELKIIKTVILSLLNGLK